MTSPETKRFGRYEILGELGRGAMGVVYKARDPQIDRLVAVKTISLMGQEPEMVEEYRLRFMNEAQAAGRLHHPGIVSVFDVGEDTEKHDPYIVLEYVAGEALNRILAREKKLPLATALQVALEIAEALDYAHEQGVTHRDIKPANILITHDGHAKIADFGIAKLNLAHFTVPGKVLGTPAYMAPEQLSGEGTDGRADLFSLGVILYAMVAGHSPFQGNSATTVCFKVANRDPVMPSALDLNLPRELDAVVATAMAKDRNHRYQRGSEFAADLRHLQTVYKPGATTTSLQGLSASATRHTTRRGAVAPQPGFDLARAAMRVRRALVQPSARDLILGLATLILLLVVGWQSKLFTGSRGDAVESAQVQFTQAQPLRANQNQAALPQTQVARNEIQAPATSPSSAPTAKKTTTKMRTKHNESGAAPATEVVTPLSMVELAVRHQFKEATLSVWVDDKLALTLPLHGGAQKRMVVFGGVHGTESETLKAPAGNHMLRLRAQTADQTINLSKTISADLIGGDDKTLLITFDKHNTAMHIEWQ